MNEKVVPPAPHWYKNSVVACAPDNTLVYGSKNDIVVLQVKDPKEAPNVEIIHGAHSKHIVSVSLNRKWQDPHSYVASLGEDNIVRVWDLKTFEKKTSNKDHTEHKEAVIGAVFAGDDRVVSAAANGLIIVWNINTNESKPLNDLFKAKVTLTCLSSCPHAGWLLAFGLNNGVVVVADLRRNGQVLFKLRGHYQSVVSLAWCPVPVNVFPQNPKNIVKNKSPQIDTEVKSLKSVEKQRGKKVNPWVNLVHADDDEISDEEDLAFNSEVSDFLQECDDLTKKILGVAGSSKQTDDNDQLTPTKEQSFKEHKESDSDESEENERREEFQNRPLPQVFDPSGDFLDDSGVEDESSLEEKDDEVTKPETIEIKVIEISQKKDVSKNKDEGQEKDLSSQEPEHKETDKSTTSGKTDVLEEQDTICEENNDQEKKSVSKDKNILENNDLVSDNREEHLVKERDSTSDEKNASELKDSNVYKTVSDDKDIAKSQDQASVEDVSKSKTKDLSTKETASKTEQKQASKPEEILEEEPRTEYLLASSAKDRSVYIWRAGTDGRMQTFFHAGKKGNRRDKQISTWITLCWVTPNTILTSSATGEILAWPVPKPKESNKQYSVVHSEHSSLIFNIVTPPRYFTAYDWRQELYPASNVWSWSQDSKLINYELSLKEVSHLYFTVTALVTCFGPSLVDPNRLAIGLRDGAICVWDLSAANVNVMSVQKYQQKFTQKISSVAWHPQKEMIVGFGTEEGRAGFIDLNSKKTTMFPCYFRTQVYKVEWGPLINNAHEELGLYVLANGQIAIHDMNKPNEEPSELDLPDKLYVYKFAWKPSYSRLLLNGKDGSLVVLKKDLTAINTLYPTDKGLNVIVWHPDAFLDDTGATSRCFWFAAATNKSVIVFDCRPTEDDDVAHKVVASFEAHVKPLLSIDWCAFNSSKLVSIAADGLVQVYNVEDNCVIATFVNTYFSNHAIVAWSPIDEDFIITGDKVLRIWRVSGNPPKFDEEFLAARKRFLNKFIRSDDKADRNKIKVEIPKPKSTAKHCIVPAFYVSSDGNFESQIAAMKNLMENGMCSLDKGALNPFHIFSGKEEVSHILDLNYQQQKREGKHKACELISLWKGNIADHVNAAISENRVTPSIVMLAPMVSIKLWQDACLMYAKTLSEDANAEPLEAATYFLACHKVEEAINCLCLGSLFREALALAKQRLPENSEIITTVVEKWAQHSTSTGNFENAAYCYISIKDYENAAKVLSRRNRKEFLQFALELAEKTENKGLVDSIKFKCNELQTVKQDGGGGDTSIDTVPSGSEAVLKGIADSTDEISNVSPIESESQSQNEDEINKNVPSDKEKENEE